MAGVVAGVGALAGVLVGIGAIARVFECAGVGT
jgi:hypothetical protein